MVELSNHVSSQNEDGEHLEEVRHSEWRVCFRKKKERKENITAATWRWQLHQSCRHLEQQHHTPLNTEHQSVVDRVLISAFMMRYFFVHCCDRQREGKWGQWRGNNGKINFMHDCGGER